MNASATTQFINRCRTQLRRARWALLCFLPLLGLMANPAVAVAATLYGADGSGGNPSNLYVLNPATGAVIQTVGPIGFAVTGLAVDPTDGTLYGSTARASGTSALIRIDKNTGAGTLIGSYGLAFFSPTAADIAFLPDGTLLGWMEPSPDDLARINKATGLATVVGNAGVGTAFAGLAVDSSGTVYFGGFSTAISGSGRGLMTLNATTGAVTGTVPYSPSSNVGLGLAFDASDVLYGIERVAARNLVTIHTTTGAVTVIGPTVNRLDALAFEPDSDGDGIPDGADACPMSDLSPTVVIDGCDSGVANVLGADGCTISDDIAQCAADANNHGDFVSCVAQLTNDLKQAGVISGKEKGAIQSCAGQSSLP